MRTIRHAVWRCEFYLGVTKTMLLMTRRGLWQDGAKVSILPWKVVRTLFLRCLWQGDAKTWTSHGRVKKCCVYVVYDTARWRREFHLGVMKTISFSRLLKTVLLMTRRGLSHDGAKVSILPWKIEKCCFFVVYDTARRRWEFYLKCENNVGFTAATWQVGFQDGACIPRPFKRAILKWRHHENLS